MFQNSFSLSLYMVWGMKENKRRNKTNSAPFLFSSGGRLPSSSGGGEGGGQNEPDGTRCNITTSFHT